MTTSLDKGYRAVIWTWLEKDHQPVLGEGKALILEAIEKTGSISAAAKMLGMSYRYVWRKLAKIEEVLGQPVVMTRRSGVRGGEAELTHAGKTLLSEYKKSENLTKQILNDGEYWRTVSLKISARNKLESIVKEELRRVL